MRVQVQVKGGWKTQQPLANPMTLLVLVVSGNTSFASVVLSVITLKGDFNSLRALECVREDVSLRLACESNVSCPRTISSKAVCLSGLNLCRNSYRRCSFEYHIYSVVV